MVGLDYCPDGFFILFFLSVGIYNPVEQEVMAGQCQKIVDNMHWKKTILVFLYEIFSPLSIVLLQFVLNERLKA